MSLLLLFRPTQGVVVPPPTIRYPVAARLTALNTRTTNTPGPRSSTSTTLRTRTVTPTP